MIQAGGIVLIVLGKREALWRLFHATAVGYYLCYLAFHFFPIEGPIYTLRHLQEVTLHGGPFTWLVDRLEGFGRIHGAAFPSAHATGAVVVLIAMWLYARKTAWMFGFPHCTCCHPVSLFFTYSPGLAFFISRSAFRSATTSGFVPCFSAISL